MIYQRSPIDNIISLLRFGHTNSGFDILLESVIGQFYKKDDIDEVVKFFANKSDLGSLQRGVKKGNMFWDKIKTQYLTTMLTSGVLQFVCLISIIVLNTLLYRLTHPHLSRFRSFQSQIGLDGRTPG